MKAKLLAIVLLCFSTVASGVSAQEREIFQVPRQAEQKIDKHGACRIVRNMGEHPVMVPTNTPQEWSVGQNSFLQNITNAPGVSARSCERFATEASFMNAQLCGVQQTVLYCWAVGVDSTNERIRNASGTPQPTRTTCIESPDAEPVTIKINVGSSNVKDYEGYVWVNNKRLAPPAGQNSCDLYLNMNYYDGESAFLRGWARLVF